MHILLRGATPLIVAAALLLSYAPQAAAESATTENLDTFVRDRVDAIGVPGVAYAIVGPNGVTHSATFGEDGDGEPVTTSTPFLWGSEAKPVTATLVMQLVDDGELRLDEPVATYLPSFRLQDEAASDRITIRDLLAQTSGFSEWLDLTDDFDEEREPADVLPELAERDLEAEPGTEHMYSSVNYLVLAAVIEEVTGRPYADVLTERVLEPAGMDDAITTPEQAESSLPPGHRFLFGHSTAFTSPYDPAGAAYGYLGGTLEDASAFVHANLGDADTLLDRKDRELMYRGEAETGEDRTYGLGWRKWPIEGTDSPMVWHSGMAPGYFASMLLLPEKNRAIIVLQNASGSFQEGELLSVGFGLAQLMYGEEPVDAETDPIYWGVLGTFGAIGALLLTLLAWSIRRLARPHAGSRQRGRWNIGLGAASWIFALVAVLYGFAVALPGYYGVGLGQLALWAPDLAWLSYAILGLAAVLLVLRLAITAHAVRGGRPAPE